MNNFDDDRSAQLPLFVIAGALRVLAVVDAIAVPSVLLWWAWGWPKHGSLFGAGFSALLV